MTPDNPSNAVLAHMLEALTERMERTESEDNSFHVRVESRLATLTDVIAHMQLQQAVTEEKLDSSRRVVNERIDAHLIEHRDRDQLARDSENRSSSVHMVVVGALGVGATLLGTVVTYILR